MNQEAQPKVRRARPGVRPAWTVGLLWAMALPWWPGCVHSRHETLEYTLYLEPPRTAAAPLQGVRLASLAPPPAAGRAGGRSASGPPGLPALTVQRLTVRDPYGQSRLVYRPSTYEVRYYNYHRWATPPGERIADEITRYLRAAGLFSRVTAVSGAGGDLVLGGVVRQLEEVDQGTGKGARWLAAVSIDFWVARGVMEAPFWMRSYSVVKPAARRNPEAVVVALSQGVQEILAQLTADLRQAVAEAEARPQNE